MAGFVLSGGPPSNLAVVILVTNQSVLSWFIVLSNHSLRIVVSGVRGRSTRRLTFRLPPGRGLFSWIALQWRSSSRSTSYWAT